MKTNKKNLILLFGCTAWSASTISTKMAGICWLLIILSIPLFTQKQEPQNPKKESSSIIYWLIATTFSLFLWATLDIFHTPDLRTWQISSQINNVLRLWLLACATTFLLSKRKISFPSANFWKISTATSACLGLALVIALNDRYALPSNAIPWAAGMAMLACLLLPWTFTNVPTSSPHQRIFLLLSVFSALMGVLISQSRGIFGIWLWALVFFIWSPITDNQKRRIKVSLATALALIFTGIIIIKIPEDPLRIKEGIYEIDRAISENDHNSSIGARIALYQIGWEGFKSSPWLGVGSEIRTDYVQHPERHISDSSQGDWDPAVKAFQHVHNQYLHNAMEGGLVGLLGLLIINSSIFIMAWKERNKNHTLSWQLNGIAWVHASAGLTNVNLLHNYYALMLGLSLTIAYISSHSSQE